MIKPCKTCGHPKRFSLTRVYPGGSPVGWCRFCARVREKSRRVERAKHGKQIIDLSRSNKTRFLEGISIDKNGGCWQWTWPADRGGYARFKAAGVREMVHRLAYRLFIGAIPHGLTIDHLCRNRVCVRPDHLEAVSMRTNVIRGDTITGRNHRKTHCPRGHAYDLLNTYRDPSGRRHCIICERARSVDRRVGS